jgi:UDP-2,3-diacylglucosamine pyrophosphatase LpxH
MTKILFTSDIHLTDRYSDEYRFGVFGKLRRVAREQGATVIALLGDITDAKGGHSAALVNRITKEIDALAQEFEVYILKGNHDYTEEHLPFFGFLDLLPNVRFISDPEVIQVGDSRVLALPHAHSTATSRFGQAGGDQGSLNTLTGRRVTDLVRDEHYDMIWIHNTVRGSTMANGRCMDNHGVDLCPDEPRRHTGLYEGAQVPIIAGDVHVPQEVGPVTYLGAPHPICFGDTWLPRFILWDAGELVSIPIDAVQKLAVEIVGPSAVEGALSEVGGGDQVKVTVRLARDDMGQWQDIREDLFRQATAAGASIEAISMQCLDETFIPETHTDAEVVRLTAAETYAAYCKENMVSDSLREVGARIINL